MMTDTPSMDRRALLRGSVKIAGVSVALPAFAGLTGCSDTPATLEGKMALIGAIADRVIPETDTPGAIAAEVPKYIAAVFDQHMTEEQQSDFVQGLENINNMASGSFANTTPEKQDEMLSKLEAADDDMPGKATWRQAREMAIFGYYTSEVATQELSYEQLPGRYVGCVPLAEVGNAWLDRGV